MGDLPLKVIPGAGSMARLSLQTSCPQPLPAGAWELTSLSDGAHCLLPCPSCNSLWIEPSSVPPSRTGARHSEVSSWGTWDSEKKLSKKEGPDSFDYPAWVYLAWARKRSGRNGSQKASLFQGDISVWLSGLYPTVTLLLPPFALALELLSAHPPAVHAGPRKWNSVLIHCLLATPVKIKQPSI